MRAQPLGLCTFFLSFRYRKVDITAACIGFVFSHDRIKAKARNSGNKPFVGRLISALCLVYTFEGELPDERRKDSAWCRVLFCRILEETVQKAKRILKKRNRVALREKNIREIGYYFWREQRLRSDFAPCLHPCINSEKSQKWVHIRSKDSYDQDTIYLPR